MKNKGVPMWQRINNAIEKLSFVECFVLAVVISVVIVCILAAMGVVKPQTSTEIYQATFADCMTHEDMTKYQCHQIALAEVED